jgi:hypothetical protein
MRSDAPSKTRVRKLLWSFLFGLVLTLVIGTVASVPHWSAVGVLLAPGMLLSALIFTEGIHSDWPNSYLILAALLNALALAFPLLWLWNFIGHFRNRKN